MFTHIDRREISMLDTLILKDVEVHARIKIGVRLVVLIVCCKLPDFIRNEINRLFHLYEVTA